MNGTIEAIIAGVRDIEKKLQRLAGVVEGGLNFNAESAENPQSDAEAAAGFEDGELCEFNELNELNETNKQGEKQMKERDETIRDIVLKLRQVWQGREDVRASDWTGADMLRLAKRIEMARMREVRLIHQTYSAI